MTSDKVNSLANMPTRQKVTAGVVVVIVLIVIWQLYGMLFGGSSNEQPAKAAPSAAASKRSAANAAGPAGALKPGTPTPADIMQPTRPMTPNEAAIMQLQQETQASYLAALGQLQMLKVQRDIAVTSKDISTAKLATATSQKKIIDMLTPPTPAPNTELINKNIVAQSASVLGNQDVRYSVVSVSQLQSRWSAVLSYKGSLYSVHTGDMLAPDGSKVISIGNDGVTIQKDGERKKLPLITSI